MPDLRLGLRQGCRGRGSALGIAQLGAVVVHSVSVRGPRLPTPSGRGGTGLRGRGWLALRVESTSHAAGEPPRRTRAPASSAAPAFAPCAGARPCAVRPAAHVLKFLLVTESLCPSVCFIYYVKDLTVRSSCRLPAALQGGCSFPRTLPRSCTARRPWLRALGPRVARWLQLTN